MVGNSTLLLDRARCAFPEVYYMQDYRKISAESVTQAEKYVTSAYVTATKRGPLGIHDDVGTPVPEPKDFQVF